MDLSAHSKQRLDEIRKTLPENEHLDIDPDEAEQDILLSKEKNQDTGKGMLLPEYASHLFKLRNNDNVHLKISVDTKKKKLQKVTFVNTRANIFMKMFNYFNSGKYNSVDVLEVKELTEDINRALDYLIKKYDIKE